METRSRSTLSTILLVSSLVLVAIVPAAADAQMVPRQMVVGFHALPMTLAQGDIYDGAVVVRTIPQLSALVVTTIDPDGFAERQRADANVRYVENDDPIPLLLLTPNDPMFSSMYGPQQVAVEGAWDTTLGDADAAVCVLDTGVRRTHEDLGTARYLGGWDYVNNDANPDDDQGHGTHVAGTAVGLVNNGIGVAGMGNLAYYAVKVLNSGGSGSWSGVASGVTWCADNTIQNTVLSLSLGGGGGATVLADAVHYAYASKGKLVVAASGNGYCDNCVLYPGAYPEAIAVACTDSAQASCVFTSKGPQVDVAAPGNDVVSTCYTNDTAYCTKSGTSMSTPHASGIMALAWSHHTSLTAACLWQRVNNTVDDLGVAGKDNAFGWGRMNAANLIAGTGCEVPPPQPPNTPTLTATAGPGAGQIGLSWNVPANGGSPITGYKVYRATNASGPFTLFASPTTNSFSESGLGNGVTVYYKVSAVNALGESALSNVGAATTFVLPSAPLSLDARPGGSPTSTGALLSIDLSWQNPSSNGGTAITRYNVYRDGAYVGFAVTNGYRDANLDPTRVYHYRVTAVNVVGEGPLSNEACSRPNPWPQQLQEVCEIP